MDRWTVRQLRDTLSSARPTRVITLLSRLFLGGIFVYASADKILHPVSFAEIVYNYQILPDVLVNLTALLLPWIELLIGLALILGFWPAGAIVISNLLLLIFFSALLFNLVRGLDIDCGCFTSSMGSSSGDPMVWYLFRDGFFLLVGVFLFLSFFFGARLRNSSPGKPWRTVLGQTLSLTLSAVLLGLIVNQARSDSMPLLGDWSPEARITLKFGRNILIPFEEARDRYLAGEAVFIDARAPEFYQEGHLPEAINLPLADFDQVADQRVMELPEDTLFVTYCDGEDCALAAEVALKLKKIGFENVRVLHDGWTVWKKNRFPSRARDPSG